MWPFPSLFRHSHLAWPFSPCIHLLWPFLTLRGYSHLASTLCDHFPPCVGILTSHDHSNLVSTSCDHFLLHNFAILCGHKVEMATQVILQKYMRKFLEIFIIYTLDIAEVTSTQSCLAWMWDDFANLTLRGHSHLAFCVKLSLPPCKSHLIWPFSPHVAILILCPPRMDAKWQSCLVWTWGDFAKVYKGKFLEIFIICALEIADVISM